MAESRPVSRSWLNLATAIEQTLLTNFEPNFSDTEWQEVIKALRAAASEKRDTVTVPRSLAERSEAMFRSVDPQAAIAQEWKEALHAANR